MQIETLFYIIQIARRRRAVLQRLFRGLEMDMTPLEAGILTDVACNPGCSQDFVACRRAVDKANIARRARMLEEYGLLVREQDPDNRRQYKLRLTKAGERCAQEIRSLDESYADFLFSDLSGEEQEVLEKLLRRLSERSGLFGEEAGEEKRQE